MANNVTPNDTTDPASFSFTSVDLTGFASMPTDGQLPASALYVGADGSTKPTAVTDAHPLPITARTASGTEISLATSTLQSTGNSSLSSIDGKLPELSGGAVPVTVGGTVAVSGTFWQATQPISAASLPLPSGAATAAKQPALGTAGTASADVVTIQGVASMTPVAIGDNGGSVTVDAPVGTPVFVRLSDGSAAIATLPVSLASVPSHAVTNTGTFAVQQTSSTSGGWTPYSLLSAGAANQDATVVKASAGQLAWVYVANSNAALRYLKIYDLASGATSSSTPLLRIPIPGNTAGAGVTFAIPGGLAFGTGISLRLTTGAADNDANAVAANEIVVNLGYA